MDPRVVENRGVHHDLVYGGDPSLAQPGGNVLRYPLRRPAVPGLGLPVPQERITAAYDHEGATDESDPRDVHEIGPQGPQGPAGVSGLQLNTCSASIDPGVTSAQCSCPSGKKALSGGFGFPDNVYARVMNTLSGSYPTADLGGWNFDIKNVNATISFTATLWVVCATAQ